jgi:hypothetical protein
MASLGAGPTIIDQKYGYPKRDKKYQQKDHLLFSPFLIKLMILFSLFLLTPKS